MSEPNGIIELGLLANNNGGNIEFQKEHCMCDPEVGMAPCQYCAIDAGLRLGLKLRAENENLRRVIRGDCENETLIEREALKVLTAAQVHGDSYGVPGPVGIVEQLVKEVIRLRAEIQEALNPKQE